MKPGDLVKWMNAKGHDYMNADNARIGIFVKQVDVFDHWILAEILDENCKKIVVMLMKEINPIQQEIRKECQ